MSQWWVVIEEAADPTSWLTIGPYTVPLNHLRFGNDKALQPRQIVRRDLVMNQTSWPRHRIMNFTYTNLLRKAQIPRNSVKPCLVNRESFPSEQVLQYLRDYPGQPATLDVPEMTNPVKEKKGVTYHGIIINHIEVELEDDRVEVTLVMDVLKEYYPEGAMKLR